MSTDDERPVPRTRPRPARAGGDPARPPSPSAPPPAAPASVARGGRRAGRAQALVQLNTRVVPVLDELVALVQEERGISKREVVEHALRQAYPVEYRRLMAQEDAS